MKINRESEALFDLRIGLFVGGWGGQAHLKKFEKIMSVAVDSAEN